MIIVLSRPFTAVWFLLHIVSVIAGLCYQVVYPRKGGAKGSRRRQVPRAARRATSALAGILRGKPQTPAGSSRRMSEERRRG